MLKNSGLTKRSRRFKVEEQLIDHDSSKPVFSFKFMNYCGKCCISKRHNEDKSGILNRLLRLSQLTWRQIASEPRKGLGFEVLPQHEFRHGFPDVVTSEVNILVFRYSDAGRMAGFRIKDIYHIVMVGDDLYPH